MLENFLRKILTTPILPSKISRFTGIFEAFIQGFQRHNIYFVENLWVVASDVSLFTFCFFYNFLNQQEEFYRIIISVTPC